METEEPVAEFEIRIDFSPDEGDPARVFRTMSGLIDAFQSIDSHLASSFDVSLDASLVLHEVEAGSIKARFRDLIQGIPDEALKEVSWKKIIGHFLLRSKYAILNWLDERTEIVHRDDIRVLEGELVRISEETDLKRLPAYAAPRAEELLSDINAVQESLAHLEEKDVASYRYDKHEVNLNRDLRISNEIVREVLTKEVVSSSNRRVVKVKKPDFLGQSMWALQYDGRAIEAKITDTDWLSKFQGRGEDVKPGDSLRVMLLEEISYGYEGEVVHRHYEVEKVYEIIRPPTQAGMRFQ
ncbi:MAG: hypothetical protein N0C84_11005 [Candidatus Thiodiazotropha taylori]|uniref:Uncharacterized protein n=1 Tax=Candidatus Thiodiazotropha taylori TaxID=2792791 RepID=A0A9E4KCV9_9GAMM|nr:hypothetical protein [Candidatus Thiodiazotropha taylori]MCW4256980.1 hypothetical protein [Candidatus Thiodiazotropha taylori]